MLTAIVVGIATTAVGLALVIRIREARVGDGERFRFRDVVPLLGALLCLAFLAFQGAQLL